MIVTLVDDIDGTTADETVRFELDGVAYEIDLTAENARALRTSLAEYIAAGRRLSRTTGAPMTRTVLPPAGPKPARTPRLSAKQEEDMAIRAWARRTGRQVADRGAIANVIRMDYAEAMREEARRGRDMAGQGVSNGGDSVGSPVAAPPVSFMGG